MSFDSDSLVHFFVEKSDGTIEKALTFFISDFYFNFTLLIEGMRIQANLTEMHLSSINCTDSTIGPVPMDLVTMIFNLASDLAIPFINDFWAATSKVSIPDSLLGLFKLSDL